MKIVGSVPSPFVRRLRVLLADVNHEFIDIDIFSPDGQKMLFASNPARKIPILIDGDTTVYDSGVIYRYLATKLGLSPLSWQQENQLTIINAANDSLVELLLCKRSGFDVNDDKLFFNLQHQRVKSVLTALETDVQTHFAKQWDYLAISLACLLDWIQFRELADLSPYPALLAYWQQSCQHPAMQATNPRN